MTLNAYLNRLRLMWNIRTVRCCGTPGTFQRHCFQFCMCILTKQHGVRGGNYLLKTPFPHFRDSRFQNVPSRCFGSQKLVPLCDFQTTTSTLLAKLLPVQYMYLYIKFNAVLKNIEIYSMPFPSPPPWVLVESYTCVFPQWGICR